MEVVCADAPHAALEYFNYFERFFAEEIAQSNKEGKKSHVLKLGSSVLEDIIRYFNIPGIPRKHEAILIRKLAKLGVKPSEGFKLKKECERRNKWDAFQVINLASMGNNMKGEYLHPRELQYDCFRT